MNLYPAVRDHDFSESTCFLCGKNIAEGDDTKEHVFPKWLLKQFGLWDRKIELLNTSTMPYRKLVIPCCQECNNEHLSKVEQDVKSNFYKGAEALRAMDRRTLMLWVLKIFFGLLYREVFLPLDRKDKSAGSIVPSEEMEQFQLLHYMLQACRVPMSFQQMDSDIPASLYVFKVQEPSLDSYKFDFKDNLRARTMYMRMGKVGILAAFDMGAQTCEGQNFFTPFQQHDLHPTQFEELGANFFMKALKFNRTPKVMFSEGPKGVNFTVAPIAGLSTRPVFDEWTVDEMAEMLIFFTGLPKEVVMPTSNALATCLRIEDGSIQCMKLEA